MLLQKRCKRNRKNVWVICMSRRVVELFHELVVDIGEVVRELQRTVVCTVIWRGRQEIVWLSYTLEETLWSNACVIEREKYLGCVWEACGWTLSSIERVVKWLVREFVSCELSYVPWYGVTTKNCLLFYAWRRDVVMKWCMHNGEKRLDCIWVRVFELSHNRPSR